MTLSQVSEDMLALNREFRLEAVQTDGISEGWAAARMLDPPLQDFLDRLTTFVTDDGESIPIDVSIASEDWPEGDARAQSRLIELRLNGLIDEQPETEQLALTALGREALDHLHD
jgi:hypothetical protein